MRKFQILLNENKSQKKYCQKVQRYLIASTNGNMTHLVAK
jgi:hypothetical protein